jgi:hypothetical protein
VKRCWMKSVLSFLTIVLLCCSYAVGANAQEKAATGATIKLPQPVHDGTLPVEKALAERRSVRAYKPEALSLAEVSQILWAAQSVIEPSKGLRTAPSLSRRRNNPSTSCPSGGSDGYIPA